jgi:hypothetical protein
MVIRISSREADKRRGSKLSFNLVVAGAMEGGEVTYGMEGGRQQPDPGLPVNWRDQMCGLARDNELHMLELSRGWRDLDNS